MKKRLFIYSTLILVAGLLGFFAVSVYVTHSNNLLFAEDAVMETARVYAAFYSADNSVSSFISDGNDTRITIIASDGTVLADSRSLNLDSLENHLNRPEIQSALNGAPEPYIRHSETLGVDLIYYALKVDTSDNYVFVRAAIPIAKIDAYMSQSLPLLIIILLVVTSLCFVFSNLMINKTIKPFESVEQKLRQLTQGEYKQESVADSFSEIEAIIREIDDVAQILQNSLFALREEKEKAEYFLNNIGDGLFAVDMHKNVVLINQAAIELFGVTPDIIGKNMNYLTYDNMLANALDDCINSEKNTLFELTLTGRIYLVAIKRLPASLLSMAVLSDVTDNRESAKQREEFFANASHELKTPLTAIKGFNELTALNNKDESIQKYIDSITREITRMLSLIDDMLKLSEIENKQDINPVSLSLASVVSEVRETLSAAINEKSIIFEMTGDSIVNAESAHIYELIKNLIENAVRYNNNGGTVSIMIQSENGVTSLSVSDDGIGIPPEEQSRVFERFYRVEKSRSGRSGGTGLGLSIVKHVCALYGWELSLKSKLSLGTEVVVSFNDK